jgi:hypothetical protein
MRTEPGLVPVHEKEVWECLPMDLAIAELCGLPADWLMSL